MPTEADDPLAQRRDALQRIVYGTPDPSDADIAELTAVEAEFVAREAARGGDPRAVETPEPAQSPGRASVLSAGPIGGTPSSRRSLPRWVVGGALAAMLVALVPLLAPVRGALSPPRGLEVFDRPATAEEQALAAEVVADAGLESVSSTVRSLGRGFGYEFWVYRDEDRVCLLSRREFWFAWVDECVTVEEFGASGLSRVIPAGELPDSARPSGLTLNESVVASWGPSSIELEWSVTRVLDAELRADRDPAPDPTPGGSFDDGPMTYEEWSSSRAATQPGGS